jgi:thiamine-monophosphate kinase
MFQHLRVEVLAVTRIGQIEAERALRLMDAQGQPVPNRYASFDHFA